MKARPPPAEAGTPGWLLGAGAAFAAVIALSAVGWVVLSRRKKAPRSAPQKAEDGMLTPEAALAALTKAPAPGLPAGAPPPAVPPAAEPPGPAAPEAIAETGMPAIAALEGPASGTRASAPPEAVALGATAPGEAAAPAAPAAREAPAAAAAIGGPIAEVRPEAAPTPAAPPAALNCPSCAEPLEPGWKVCPACGSKLEEAAAVAAPAPDAGVPAGPARSDFTDDVTAIRRRIEVLTAMDKDVSALQSTLDLAASFHRTGKQDKAQKYLEKAKEMLSELDRA